MLLYGTGNWFGLGILQVPFWPMFFCSMKLLYPIYPSLRLIFFCIILFYLEPVLARYINFKQGIFVALKFVFGMYNMPGSYYFHACTLSVEVCWPDSLCAGLWIEQSRLKPWSRRALRCVIGQDTFLSR